MILLRDHPSTNSATTTQEETLGFTGVYFISLPETAHLHFLKASMLLMAAKRVFGRLLTPNNSLVKKHVIKTGHFKPWTQEVQRREVTH